jgi:hypothetical protein
MPEPRDARSIIENAEQAATAGNYASAEDLLREAAALQEQTLGPTHPDLANTLNNLGIVCEMTDNPIDAEHYFRRAHAIATATLAPDHPFVATSSKNLHDFCSARGRPVELPPSSPAVAAWLDAPVPAPAPAAAPAAAPAQESSRSSKTQDVTPLSRKRFSSPLAVGALSGVGVLIVILTVARPWDRPVEAPESRPAATRAPAIETPAPPRTAPPAEPPAQPQPAAKLPQPAPSQADTIGPTPGTPARAAGLPTVATAQLCTALRAWRCEAADSQVPPGPMFFYTQLKSATTTTIEHRWYQGDRVRRAVRLRVEANPGTGYRTYSRTTITSGNAGDWRVELRSADGTMLHEERFTVR